MRKIKVVVVAVVDANSILIAYKHTAETLSRIYKHFLIVM